MSKNEQTLDPQISLEEKNFLLQSISKLKGRKVLVIGDVGLDEYIMGEVRRISPEAPVPILEVEKEEHRLGLAANVAQNVQSLGGEPLLISVVGKDAGYDLLTSLFRQNSVSTDHLVTDETRPTTRKSRVMAKHHHLVRVDYETRKFISDKTEKLLLDKVQQLISTVDCVVVEDYNKGAISQNLMKKTVEIAKAHGKPVYVDPHRSNAAEFYAGCSLIKPNFDEAVLISGLNYDELRDHPDKVFEVGRAVQRKTGAQHLVMTRGKDGMTIFSGDKVTQVPTFARQVFDVTGAGDTVIAAISLSLSAGLDLRQSCMLANFAAGVVVGQVGCVPCSQQELKEYIESTLPI